MRHMGKINTFLTSGTNTKFRLILRTGLPNPRPAFHPERDTVFFRPMASSSLIQDNPRLLVNFVRSSQRTVQHIAVPFSLKRELVILYLICSLTPFPKLRTLTLMLGCEEKTRRGDPSIELRHLREWLADGRPRTIMVEEPTSLHVQGSSQCRRLCDVAEVPKLIAKHLTRDIAVRIVAWKRRT